MLDQLAIVQYPGRIAAIEIHTRIFGDTLLYSAEGYQRLQTLPGDFNSPRLYIDGHRHPGWYYQWQDSIVPRMNIPACVNIRMNGTFNPGNGQGTITAWYRNDSTALIRGRVMFVITEDSVYFMDSLGGQRKEWHNHTARDYIPGPLGTMLTVAAGDSVSFTQSFAIAPLWRYQYCKIVTFIQDSVARPDSMTKNIWQGAEIKVSQLVGVAEPDADPIALSACPASPNPCRDRTRISFELPVAIDYRLTFYDITGRTIRTYAAASRATTASVEWDCRDDRGMAVSPGVYPYRLQTDSGSISGTVVVR